MSKGKFALGAVVGAAIGAVAALLTAPKSGKETRADIKKKAGEVKDMAVEKTTQMKAATEKTAADAKKRAEDIKEDLEKQAKDLRFRTESAVKGARDGFNNPSKR